MNAPVHRGEQREAVEVSGFGDAYRLSSYGTPIGSEEYFGSVALCLGDEICEQLGYERDSIGYVFPTRAAAQAAKARVLNALWRFSHG